MKSIRLLVAGCLVGLSTSCANLTAEDSLAITQNVIQIATLDDKAIAQAASLSAKELDSQHKIAPANSQYAIRLQRLIKNYHSYDGLKLNYAVYLDNKANAFAMPDGTIRVYSGLLDLMPDDQVVAVIGHEIGHVKLKHSYNQMKKQLITNTAFKTISSVGGTVGDLTKGQLGQLSYAYLNARFSQQDELASDEYAVKFLASQNLDPEAMRRSIETLSKLSQGGSHSFFSSHPSNDRRIQRINAAINSL